MIEVHVLARSRAHRILWLLEELGLEYEIVRYERDPATLAAPEALKQVHPLGKSPVVVADGVVLAESGAIIETLLARYPNDLRPAPGSDDERAYLFYLHHAEGSAMPVLQTKLIAEVLPRQVPGIIRPIARAIMGGLDRARLTPELQRMRALWEARLAEAPWFAGAAFSAADIQMSYPVEAMLSRGEASGVLAGFLERCRARPAFVRALERAGLEAGASTVPNVG